MTEHNYDNDTFYVEREKSNGWILVSRGMPLTAEDPERYEIIKTASPSEIRDVANEVYSQLYDRVLASIKAAPTNALREWMHNGEYEGGLDDIMDSSVGLTNAQWVDKFTHDELVEYITERVRDFERSELEDYFSNILDAQT